MKHLWLTVLALLALTSASLAHTAPTPESCLRQVTDRIEALLAKEQHPLYAWHLRSIRAIAQTEYAKLPLDIPQNRHPVPEREKEFVQYASQISQGLDGECSNPDAYLKEGRRTLVLARPSNTDGTLEYMMVDLPKNWDPNRAYPLFVGLHGSGPDNPLAYPSFGFGPPSPPNPEEPSKPTSEMIRLSPWGRGNRSWRNDAERDLFEAIAMLQTFCKLDPDRWYISGHSSGADGCWAIIQHTPDLWAAAGIQSGSMLWGEPAWGLIPNMTYLPVHFLIGEKDPLPHRIQDMHEAYLILTKGGDQTKLVVLPGVGHYPLTEAGLDEQAEWMTRFVRKRPDRFTFTVDQPYHPGVWGITIPLARDLNLIKEPWPTFECEVHNQDVRIKTRHTKKLTVDLGPKGLGMSGVVKLWINGKLLHDGLVPDEALRFENL